MRRSCEISGQVRRAGKTIRFLLFAVLTAFVFLPGASAQEKNVFVREDFSSLDNWKQLFFPNIKRHSVYTAEREGGQSYLKAESDASASAIVYKESFSVYDYPRVRWRWKVMHLYAKADPRTKQGDDYPLRVYVMFEYEPGKAGVFEKLKYGMAKKLYGEYPPQCTLGYVWSSKDDPQTIIVSPYTDKAVMILLEKGPAKAGTWQDEEVNILEDYRKAFGSKPPARARLAIMNDSDNTGESSVSYVADLEVFR